MNKLIYIIFLISFLTTTGFTQSSSPYSRYGIGDMEHSFSARQLSIGQLGITMLDAKHISSTNPASWSVFNRTRIEFSLSYNGINISNSSKSGYYAETEIDGFAFGIPVSTDHGIGVTFGLVPYSRISYKTEQTISNSNPDISNYKLNFEGKGGLSRLFLGSSYRLPFGWSIGASADYYFGNLKYLSSITFLDNSNLPSEYELDYRPTGFGTTAGFISGNIAEIFDSSFVTDLRIGASFNYISNLNTDTLLTTTSSILVDTIGQSTVTMEIPLRISAGISFTLSNNYLISFDYSYQPFSQYKLNNKTSNTLRDAFKFSTGFEFLPTQKLGMTLWEQIIWRAGLSYEETPYQINGTGINQYSVYGGFTVPLGVDNSIDIALQYAMRGTTDSNLLKEDIIKLNLGISFGELWFLRYEK